MAQEPVPEPEDEYDGEGFTNNTYVMNIMRDFIHTLNEYGRSTINVWKEDNGYRKVKDINVIFDLIRRVNSKKWNWDTFRIDYVSNKQILYESVLEQDWVLSHYDPDEYFLKWNKGGRIKFMNKFTSEELN